MKEKLIAALILIMKEMVKRVAILIVSIIVLIALLLGLSGSGDRSKGYEESATATKSTIKPDMSDPERLNVSGPTFSTAGIRFMLNDTRPNTALWVSVEVGRASADKNLLGWVSPYGAKPGVIAVPFKECKYMDAGIDSLASAAACKVTIGARLKDADKIVYTAYDAPISELRTSLANAAR